MTRYEVRIQEIDGSTDIVPVWAGSEQEAMDRALTFIDYIERRPMYGQPASAVEIGSTTEAGDLGDTITSPEDVAHRRVAADGTELGTIRRPVKARIAEMTELMRTSDTGGWRDLREAMREVDLDPFDCVLVLEILHGDVPVSGALIARDGGIFGFVRDEGGTLSVAGGGAAGVRRSRVRRSHRSRPRDPGRRSPVADPAPMLRRKRLPDDLEAPLERLRTVVEHVEAGKDAMTSTVPTTRLPGTPLPDALLELEEHLERAKELMPGWRHPDVEDEWLACDEGIDESLRRATKLREEAPDLGGFEGLIWAVDQVLAPLEAFEAAAERFRSLR